MAKPSTEFRKPIPFANYLLLLVPVGILMAKCGIPFISDSYGKFIGVVLFSCGFLFLIDFDKRAARRLQDAYKLSGFVKNLMVAGFLIIETIVILFLLAIN